jgi:hypothetical protein
MAPGDLGRVGRLMLHRAGVIGVTAGGRQALPGGAVNHGVNLAIKVIHHQPWE